MIEKKKKISLHEFILKYRALMFINIESNIDY